MSEVTDDDLVPTIDEFRPVVLRVLADGVPRRSSEIRELAADAAGLSEAARSQLLASGQRRYYNRVGWACSALNLAGLLTRPRRGTYAITENGKTVDARGLSSYSESDMLEWPDWVRYQQEISDRRAAKTVGSAVAVIDEEESVDPIEGVEGLVSSYNSEVETKLRRRLQESTPEFFEKAVIELLWAMGYGGSHGEKKHVGKSGDGGIDGIISQDALGLTNVYVQAKRYADTSIVGSPEIRNFIGALDSHGATLGVFITTSRFVAAAVATATAYRHGRIVLIDGVKLTSLMLDYGVAVQKYREFTMFEIDEDFFDGEA